MNKKVIKKKSNYSAYLTLLNGKVKSINRSLAAAKKDLEKMSKNDYIIVQAKGVYSN